VIREDNIPAGVRPYTDGASLFIFYGGPGINSQVISDFTYSAINQNSIQQYPALWTELTALAALPFFT
jgi:hypothetical protein